LNEKKNALVVGSENGRDKGGGKESIVLKRKGRAKLKNQNPWRVKP